MGGWEGGDKFAPRALETHPLFLGFPDDGGLGSLLVVTNRPVSLLRYESSEWILPLF